MMNGYHYEFLIPAKSLGNGFLSSRLNELLSDTFHLADKGEQKADADFIQAGLPFCLLLFC